MWGIECAVRRWENGGVGMFKASMYRRTVEEEEEKKEEEEEEEEL